MVASQFQAVGGAAAIQKNHHRHHPVGLAQLGQVEAVMGQAVDIEAPGGALLFENKEQRLALPVGPLHQKRNIEFPEPVAETLL